MRVLRVDRTLPQGTGAVCLVTHLGERGLAISVDVGSWVFRTQGSTDYSPHAGEFEDIVVLSHGIVPITPWE